MKIPLIVILGATATGKTRLGIELAKMIGGEIISGDSMQIYRGMDIGTAKPDQTERAAVPHHLIDIMSPAELFSVSDYVSCAKKTVSEIWQRAKYPIVAGGTGLYISSLINNIQFAGYGRNDKIREALCRRYAQEGAEALYHELLEIDPAGARKIHPNDKKRVVRALEVYTVTKIPMSEWERRSQMVPSEYRTCILGLKYENRTALYDKINSRVDRMLKEGLVEEVRELLDGGVPEHATAMQAIGYKELIRYLKGSIPYGEAVESIKRETRRYAKRQISWFGRMREVHWIEASLPVEMQAGISREILDTLKILTNGGDS